MVARSALGMELAALTRRCRVGEGVESLREDRVCAYCSRSRLLRLFSSAFWSASPSVVEDKGSLSW